MNNYLLITNNFLQLNYIKNIFNIQSISINDLYEINDSTIIFNSDINFLELKKLLYENNNVINELLLMPLNINNEHLLMTNGIKDFLWVNTEQKLELKLTKHEIYKKIEELGIDSITDEESKILQDVRK